MKAGPPRGTWLRSQAQSTCLLRTGWLQSSSKRTQAGGITGATVDKWEAAMRLCWPASLRGLRLVTWKCGVVDAAVRAEGPRIFYDLEGELQAEGGEARWLKRRAGEICFGDDGYASGRETALRETEEVVFDKAGLPTLSRRSSLRASRSRPRRLMVFRARLLMPGDVLDRVQRAS